MRYHLYLLQSLSSMNKPTSIFDNVEKRETCVLLMGLKIDSDTMGNSMEFPQKIKNITTILPSNSTSGYWFEETQITYSKRYI